MLYNIADGERARRTFSNSRSNVLKENDVCAFYVFIIVCNVVNFITAVMNAALQSILYLIKKVNLADFIETLSWWENC